MSDLDHAWLMQRQCVAQGWAPDDEKGQGQGQNFAEIRQGDYFYLVRNSKVILLGRFTSNVPVPAPAERPSLVNWWIRPYDIIKNIGDQPLVSTAVPGSQAWKPQGYSTIWEVPKKDYAEFESALLLPAFSMHIAELALTTSNSESPMATTNSKPAIALNRILYGPPGTGKTFSTVLETLRVIEGTDTPKGSYDEQRKRFQKLRKEGRVAFVTFHQSFSYEDFVEGVRADVHGDNLSYRNKDGIFKQMATSALFDKIVWTSASDVSFPILYQEFIKTVRANLPYSLTSSTGRALRITSVSEQGTVNIAHHGSDITHPIGVNRVQKLYEAYPTRDQLKTITNLETGINGVIGQGNRTAYWALISGLLDFKERQYDDLTEAQSDNNEGGDVAYEDKKTRIASADEPEYRTGRPYVLVIDEINRGNTSRIFGELITLVEASKRIGASDEIQLQLPYSNDTFGVPDNLYLIGTMNTADRSLTQIDTALRRRFDFIEMMPQPKLLKHAVAGVDLCRMLEAINSRIEHLYDREHMIGHAFFMHLDENSTVAELAQIFRNKVLPLLEEYFFEDWDKIAKVLGKAEIYTVKHPKDLGFETTTKVYRRDTDKLEQASTYIRIYDLQVLAPLAQAVNE
jgi:5-methylcytosine-specific restriction protein B